MERKPIGLSVPHRKVKTIHSCSYYCHRPECIKAQRDELRDKYIKQDKK